MNRANIPGDSIQELQRYHESDESLEFERLPPEGNNSRVQSSKVVPENSSHLVEERKEGELYGKFSAKLISELILLFLF